VSGVPSPSLYMDVPKNRSRPIGQDPIKPRLSLRRGTVHGIVRHGKFQPHYSVIPPLGLLKSSPGPNAPHSDLSDLRDPSIYRPTATWRHHDTNINHGAPLSSDADAYRTSLHHVQQKPEVLSPVRKRSIANVCTEPSPLPRVNVEIIQNKNLTQTTSPRVITSFKNFTNTAVPLLDRTYLPHGGDIKTDRRGTYLLGTLSKNGIVPIRVNKKYTFYKNVRTTFLDIISTYKGLVRKYKRSKIPNVLLASDHTLCFT
jgi:hypothetical protein